MSVFWADTTVGFVDCLAAAVDYLSRHIISHQCIANALVIGRPAKPIENRKIEVSELRNPI